MSTDDSISEDVSSSGALSHCHVGDGGKESEASLVSSEGTSASGLAISEERHTTSKTAGCTVESRPVHITPACNKIRCSNFKTTIVYKCTKNTVVVVCEFIYYDSVTGVCVSAQMKHLNKRRTSHLSTQAPLRP